MNPRLPSKETRRENAQLERRILRAHEDVVGLHVGVHDAEAREVAQRGEELARVLAHGLHVDADVLAELLERLAQVHLEALEDEHRVRAVLALIDDERRAGA